MALARPARTASFLAVFALAFSAGEAFGFFDAQILAGKRWYVLEGDDVETPVQSQEISVAAHLSPIPLVPVSIGALINVGSFRKDDIDKSTGFIKEAALFQGALDIQAWVPLIPILTPYARLSVPLYGVFALEGGEGLTKYVSTSNLTGVQLSLGAKFSFIPLVSILLEAGTGMEKIKLTEEKLAGTKNDDPDDKAYGANSKSFKLGVEVGI